MRLPNIQNNYSKSLQVSDLEYCFWRFDKQIPLSENKPPLEPLKALARLPHILADQLTLSQSGGKDYAYLAHY